MKQLAASIFVSSDLSNELAALSGREGIEVSKPVLVDSASDILNAPLNLDALQAGLEMVQVIFATGASALAFATALLEFLRERQQVVEVRDPATGEVRGKIEADTSPDIAKDVLTG